jgi:D-beta-D-heptose 7-phosphate kinase/D-beta-D-heptose 1-phosphate adenosyltransferase
MKAEEIIRYIYDLDIYTQEQFSEYLGYFRQKNGACSFLQQPASGPNEIKKRIKAETGATPVHPDYRMSEKVTTAQLLNKRYRKPATLGIVSGCFDLLHLGHVRNMDCAKRFLLTYPSPLLVVLTLSDENIRMKKGDSRPVLNFNERLDMICSVECIDYVIPLEEPNCLAVLNALKPDYFFKANADRSQGIVRQEMELVELYGGKVEVFPSRPEAEVKSTTKMIESVLESMMREW